MEHCSDCETMLGHIQAGNCESGQSNSLNRSYICLLMLSSFEAMRAFSPF